MPSRSGVRDPDGSMSCRWPDYHRIQIPTYCTLAFDGCYRRVLNTRASLASLIVLTDQDFNRVELGEHDASLIHVIHFFL